MPSTPRLLTGTEVADLAGRLEGCKCTPRQVRYLLVAGRVGSDAGPRTRGQTRLHGVIDVAFMRLALRLSQAGMSAAVTRVVLTYLRADIIRGWKSGAQVALAVRGVQGSLEPTLKGKPPRVDAWVPLRDVWYGLETHMQRVCDARTTVWMWRKVAVHAVPSS